MQNYVIGRHCKYFNYRRIYPIQFPGPRRKEKICQKTGEKIKSVRKKKEGKKGEKERKREKTKEKEIKRGKKGKKSEKSAKDIKSGEQG